MMLPDPPRDCMGKCEQASHSAPLIGSEAENTSGERGGGQAETARVYSIIGPSKEISLRLRFRFRKL
jgi:hypothetical protein